MGFRHIQWLAVALPALSVGLFEFFRHQWLEPLLPGWWGHVIAALVVAGAVYGFVRIFIEMVRKSASELTRARSEAAVILERQRIAREMHDGVAQALFYLTVKLREVELFIKAGEGERAHQELQALEVHLKETYEQVRWVIADLKKQAELEDFGEAVRRTANQVAERLGVQVACEIAGRPSLPASSQQHLLAIIQEALINARRHGHARRAMVRVHALAEGVKVQVDDDGTGFDPDSVPREGRYGLTIMAERAQMVGGEFQLDSKPGRGTRITVHIPGVEP